MACKGSTLRACVGRHSSAVSIGTALSEPTHYPEEVQRPEDIGGLTMAGQWRTAR
jgi:hypothetical protein